MAAHIETGTMASPSLYKSYNIDHLGLVAGMYDELGIGYLLDQMIYQDEDKRIVSVGQAVKAMVLNGLGFANQTLYLMPHFFQDKPLERLLGSGIEAEHLNDDVMGRTLDKLYSYNVNQMYSILAARAIRRLRLSSRIGHLDSTGFHVDGKYNQEPSSEGLIKITKGYSRDHRPDLNQVVLQLICENQAGIPLLMEPLNGNNSDKDSFRQTIANHIDQLNNEFKLEYIVADSALYVSKTLIEMNDWFWITRVPETLTDAQELIRNIAPDLMVNPQKMSWRCLGNHFAGVNQRWLVIFSPQAYQRGLKSVNKHCLKRTTANLKTFKKLCQQDFQSIEEAQKALSQFEKTLNLTFVAESHFVEVPHYNGAGRPSTEQKPDKLTYRIEGALASTTKVRMEQLQRKSCFILASNQLDMQALSDEQLIETYKGQQKVERGFRFLKDPMFMASTLFLKSTKRIMALMMVMTLCLLVYAALEYRIRQTLKEHDKNFPDQKGNGIQNPTARWVFQFFAGIHVLVINQLYEQVLNLNQYQLELLKILGESYERFYSDSG